MADSLFDELQPQGEACSNSYVIVLNRRGIISATPDKFNPSAIDRYLQPQISAP
jgi:ATP-dependent helicase HrpA